MGQEFVADVKPEGQNPQANNEKPKGSGLSVAALILGILSVLCCCSGFPFAIAGIILAVIALIKQSRAKPAAIIGLILSIICMISSVYSTAVSLRYKDEVADFSKNYQQYIDDYKESESLPPLIEKIKKDRNLSDEEAKSMMDMIVSMQDSINNLSSDSSDSDSVSDSDK